MNSRVNLARMRLIALLGLAITSATTVSAQQPLQTGRLLDRNPQLGSGGYNAERPYSPLLSGNAIANGDIGRGFSFRGGTGISSVNTLRSPLGSAYLSNFRRDSVSVADASSPLGGLVPRLYYDPSSTAFTPRFLGVQQPANPGLSPSQYNSNYGIGGARRIITDPSAGQPIDTRYPPTGNDTPLQAQITGISPQQDLGPRDDISNVDPRGLPASRDNRGLTNPATGTPGIGGNRGFQNGANSTFQNGAPGAYRIGPQQSPPPSPTGAVPASTNQPIDPRIDARQVDTGPGYAVVQPPMARPIDLAIGGADSAALLSSSRRGGLTSESSSASFLDNRLPPLDTRRPIAVTDRTLPSDPRLEADPLRAAPGSPITPAVLPGRDVFTDMQLAASLARDPGAPWARELANSLQQNSTLRSENNATAATDSTEFVNSVLQSPIRTFAGRGASEMNDAISAAESMLEVRHFFDATLQYERARNIDPNNPLPLIGKGHAQLAAGEYLSAANNLIAGLQRFPEISRMNVDIKAFIGDESVDIRRSDLMKRLERREDPTLRFLLGYLEYYAGMKESGMENLSRAARSADPGSLIKRYPDMLKGQGVLPPPRLPSPNGGAPAGIAPPRGVAAPGGIGAPPHAAPTLLKPGAPDSRKNSKP